MDDRDELLRQIVELRGKLTDAERQRDAALQSRAELIRRVESALYPPTVARLGRADRG